jgi:hypothetical protein
VPHADQHANANDAIEAIESTLGVNPQGGSATVVARLTALDSTVAGKAGLSLSNVFTVGAQAIRTGADAVKGLIIQRFSATQSANLLSILQSDGSTEIARIRPNGQVGVGSSSSTAATNSLLGLDHSYAGDQRSIAIKQIASPTQDVIQVQPNASTTPIFKVDSAGAVTASNVTDSALTTAGIVTNTSAGLLGTVATVPVTSGGTGVTTSTGTGNTVRSASPTFTGVPTTPTAAVGTNNFQIASTAFVIGQASATTPAMDSTAAVGTSTRYARADHVHPSDTAKVDTTDSRLTDARTPTAHASTHGVAGSDPVTVASSQVTGLATSATTDTTNASNITSGTLPNARLVSVPDSSLATISTAGKVANSATTATNANTASAIVARDASGNFSAGTITASLTGNVTGNVSGSSGSTTGNAATVTNGVYTTDTGTVTSTMILDSTILNADINASAAIAQSKLATNTAAQWSAGTAYIVGDLVYNLGVTYRRKVAGTTATAPASDTTNWAAQTAPATNSQTANTLALRDSSGNLFIGSGASINLGSSTSPSFGGGLSSAGNIVVNDGSLTTATTITGSGDVNASQSVLATNGNVSAGDDGATAFPTTTGAGNIRSVNQIITNSTASDSIKTSGGVTAASATLTTGFSTAGVVHNNTSGVLSSSLITNADVATGAAIDVTKISGAYTRSNKNTEEYRLASTFDILPRTVIQASRTLLSGIVYTTPFTPTENFTMTNFQTYCTTGGTDVGGTIVRRMGLFTVSGTTLTLVARTASDATLWNTSNTLYTRALSTTGGYPSTYTLNAGTTYAFGAIAYNTGGTFNVPTISAGSSQTQLLQPYVMLGVGSQTDLPTAATSMSTISNLQVFARLT